MNPGEELLAALALYGLPVLFIAVLVASIGVPLPVTLMVVAAGSFIEQGQFQQGPVLALGWLAAVVGDHTGYLIGRIGGRPLARRLSRRLRAERRLIDAERLAERWGGAGVFLTRWLPTPLAPWMNLASGVAAYPLHRFSFYEMTGSLTWIVLFVSLGRIFSNRVEALTQMLGNLVWALLGLIVTILLGRRLLRRTEPGA